MIIHQKTIRELSEGLRAREFSSIELTKYYLDRIKKFDTQYNSFITITSQEALKQAEIADKRIANGDNNPLIGIPIAHKDIFCTKDIKTSCGSKMLDNFISPYNATIVEQLAKNGTVMLGKTNMDEFAMGSSNETSYYGPVSNPWNIDRVPGGSSGGSAAAVASRFCVAATGTDTGGSIRQPAAFCGITGIKPTYGRVSRYGMIAFASSLDQGGIMTNNAEDAALLLQEIAGFDHRDSTSSQHSIPDYSASLNDSIYGLKIGLPEEYFNDDHLDNSVRISIEEALNVYLKMGAKVHKISLANTRFVVATYYVIASAECSSNLARFDGIRFGYRCNDPNNIEDLYKRSRSEGFGIEVKRRIIIGTYVLSAGYYDAYYLQAKKLRCLISDDFKNVFKDVDVIITPTSPTIAFNKKKKIDNPISMYLSDIYTIAVNIAGLPGISIPVAPVNKMPVGLQLIGNYFDEARLLNIAYKFQQKTGWHHEIPLLEYKDHRCLV